MRGTVSLGAAHARWVAPPLLALATWRLWPVDGVRPAAGLDPSWRIALHLAAQHGLVFGRDVIFTYGPLGFLTQPLTVDRTTGALSIAFSLVVWLGLAAIVFRGALRSFPLPAALLLAYLVLCLPVQIADALVLIAFFLTVRGLEDGPPRHEALAVVGAGAYAGVVLLVKLNDGVLTLVLFALAAWRLRPRRLVGEAVLAASCVVSVVVFWLATRNPVAALPDWLRASEHVISGYGDAMASETASRWPQYVWAGALVAAGLVLLALQLGRTRPAVWIASAIFTAAFLKEGFVRHDAHDLVFFGAFGVALIAFRWRDDRTRALAAVVVLATVAAVLATPDIRSGDLVRPFASASAALGDARLVVDGARLLHDIETSRAAARSQLAVAPRLLQALRGETVAVAPNEVAAAWAYGLRWRPVPTLQDYAAYDAYLDRANAREISRRGANRLLLEAEQTGVDGRNPLLEAPATTFARLCRYRAIRAAGRWTILARTASRCLPPRALGTRSARAGEPVPIPAAGRDELVYARIRLHTPLLRRLAAALFKPVPLPKIVIGSVTYRFVAATADDPLVVRPPSAGSRSNESLTLLDVASPFDVSFYAVRVRRP